MRVLSVAAECVPLIKTGGLADVVGALPAALAAEAVSVCTLLPGYGAAEFQDQIAGFQPVTDLDNLFGGPARLLAGEVGGRELLILDAPHLFGRGGNPYVDQHGHAYSDNHLRFAALAKVGAMLAGGTLRVSAGVDLVHAHDWHASLLPLYQHAEPVRPPVILTIHNIAFQGTFSPDVHDRLELPEAVRGDRFPGFRDGELNFLRAGIARAHAVTTVSPNYAREIQSAAFGMGLQDAIQARTGHVHGILNGIDLDAWNPATDGAIAATYAAVSAGAHRDARARNKAALVAEFGLTAADEPGAERPPFLMAVISRLTEQKGIDLLAQALPGLLDAGSQLVVLGTGAPEIEALLEGLAARYPGQVGLRFSFDEALSHRIQAGADALIVPSRFEPCGLTQLYALRYGCVPVVSRTGGLADTVIDANMAALRAGCATGFVFAPVTADELYHALRRASALYATLGWDALVENGLRAQVGWDASAKAYADLFHRSVGEAAIR